MGSGDGVEKKKKTILEAATHNWVVTHQLGNIGLLHKLQTSPLLTE